MSAFFFALIRLPRRYRILAILLQHRVLRVVQRTVFPSFFEPLAVSLQGSISCAWVRARDVRGRAGVTRGGVLSSAAWLLRER